MVVWFICLVICLLLIWKLPFFSKSSIPLIYKIVLFGVKVLCSFFLYWLYTDYYTDRSKADMYKYYDDAQIAQNAPLSDKFVMISGIGDDAEYYKQTYYLKMNHWYRKWKRHTFNDNRTMVRLHLLFGLFSRGNFHVHALCFTFMGFLGLMGIYKAFESNISPFGLLGVLVVFLLPNVLLWSSGAMKESVLMGVMGLLSFSIKKLHQKKWIWIGVTFICAVFLMYIKTYILVILIPFGVMYFIPIFKRRVWAKYVAVVLLAIAGSLLLHYTDSKWDPYWHLYRKQDDFIRMAQSENAGSTYYPFVLEPQPSSVLKAAPLAFAIVFVEPLPWHMHSVFDWVPFIENVFLFLIIVVAVFYRRKKTQVNWQLFYLIIFSTISLYVLIGLTTPVIGGVIRYKVPALPYLGILFLMLIDKEKLPKKLSTALLARSF